MIRFIDALAAIALFSCLLRAANAIAQGNAFFSGFGSSGGYG
jgi:hypothetical protein